MKNQSGSEKDPQPKENGLPATVPTGEIQAAQGAPGMALNIQSIMSQAVSAGNVEMAEKVLNLYERMKASWAKEQFDKAMAKFQSECPVIKKSKSVMEKDGRSERYKFAPLDSIVEQAGPHIANNNLSYTIKVRHDEKMMTITVTVKHTAGHSEDSEFAIPIGSETYMSEPQKYGARCTFAKRYAFCNAFGILTGDGDTDAQEAKQPAKQNTPRPAAPAKAASQEPAPNLIETPLLNQVKIKLSGYGAKSEKEALQILRDKTGLKWWSFKVSEKMAEMALAALKKKEEEEAKQPAKPEEEIEVVPVEDLPAMIPEDPKKRVPISKGKIKVIMGLAESKKGYKTEKQVIKYINECSELKNASFPGRTIESLEDLNIEETDKIIKFMMTLYAPNKEKDSKG